MTRTRSAIAACLIALGSASAGAQTASPDLAPVAQGAARLAQGDIAGAAAIAAQALNQFPWSAAALGLTVDVELARSRWPQALDAYDRWTRLNRKEDGPSLRRIAQRALQNAANDRQNGAARTIAVEALVRDGDPDVAAAVLQAAGPEDVATRAVAGDAEAITKLIAELGNPVGNKRAAIQGLAKSRSRRALNPLISVLNDPSPSIQLMAVEALGQLGFREAAPSLKPLLTTPMFAVRFAAATALFALEDPAGATALREWRTSEQPAIRVAVANATKRDPDPSWISLVRDLLSDPDPGIRRQAAVLLAPHDPDAARAVLQPLLTDANPAEKEAATDAAVSVAADLTALRPWLTQGDARTHALAAARILAMTR